MIENVGEHDVTLLDAPLKCYVGEKGPIRTIRPDMYQGVILEAKKPGVEIPFDFIPLLEDSINANHYGSKRHFH